MAPQLVAALTSSLSDGAAPSSSSSARGALGSLMAMCPVVTFDAAQEALGSLLDRKEHDTLTWQVCVWGCIMGGRSEGGAPFEGTTMHWPRVMFGILANLIFALFTLFPQPPLSTTSACLSLSAGC